MLATWSAVTLTLMLGVPPASGCPLVALVNGGFERPVVTKGAANNYVNGQVPGWFTTASDGEIELWGPGNQWANRGIEIVPAEGAQFAELDANEPATMYQDFPTEPGELLRWSLAHRARNSSGEPDFDEMFVELGPPGATVPQIADGLQSPYLVSGDTAWTIWRGQYRVPDGQTLTRIAFRPLHTSSGSTTSGNLVDDVQVATVSCLRPTPAPPSSTPAPPSPGGYARSLPVTGPSSARPLAAGLVLLAVGLALRWVVRSRVRRSPQD